MSVIEVKDNNLGKELLKGKVLIDFNATWCGPCRMLKPVLEEISNERSDYKFVSVDVDENGDLAEEYGVSSIPCLVILEDGKEIKRTVGLMPKSEFESFLGDK